MPSLQADRTPPLSSVSPVTASFPSKRTGDAVGPLPSLGSRRTELTVEIIEQLDKAVPALSLHHRLRDCR